MNYLEIYKLKILILFDLNKTYLFINIQSLSYK